MKRRRLEDPMYDEEHQANGAAEESSEEFRRLGDINEATATVVTRLHQGFIRAIKDQ